MQVEVNLTEFIKTVKKITISPTAFFKERDAKKDYGDTIGFFLLLLTASLVLSFFVSISVVTLGLHPQIKSLSQVNFGSLTSKLLVNIVSSFLLSFIWAGLTHFFIKLFRGKGKYSDSYQVYAYSRTPVLLTSFIPYMNFIGWLFGFIVLAKGTHILHRVPLKISYTMYICLILVVGILLYLSNGIVLPNVF